MTACPRAAEAATFATSAGVQRKDETMDEKAARALSALRDEVRQAVAAERAAGRPIRKQWLTHDIVSRHAPPEGAGADFALACAYATVKDMIEEAAPETAEPEPPAPEPTPEELRARGEAALRHADEIEAYLRKREGIDDGAEVRTLPVVFRDDDGRTNR